MIGVNMKKIISAFLAVVIGITMLIPAFATNSKLIKSVDVEDGVPDGYTEIKTVKELNSIRDNLNGKYILMNELDLSSLAEWEPIGNTEAPFTGVFNGNGYSIKNVTVTSGENRAVGLFGEIKNATVANLYVENISVKINYPFEIHYCVGAVAGICKSSNILNCAASGIIDVTAGGAFSVGGILGETVSGSSVISNCLSEVNIKLTGEISDEAIGTSVVHTTNAGGIAGVLQNGNALNRSINKGNIEISPYGYVNAGGIAGAAYFNAPITDCGNSGNIAVSTYATAGGICGQSHSVINCYNTGIITVGKEFKSKLGGIAGIAWFNTSRTSIYPLPEGSTPAIVSNCYYIDSYAKGISNADEGDVSTVKALSADAFKDEQSFAGFDFAGVWAMPENSAPALMSKTSEIDSYIEVTDTKSFELPESIVYAVSNNNKIVTVENNSTVVCVSSGKTSIDAINADGDFAVIEISVVIEDDIVVEEPKDDVADDPKDDIVEEPKSVLERISEFFATLVVWIINIFR